MGNGYKRYYYYGPVMNALDGMVVTKNWGASTYAKSDALALRNFRYQWCKQFGKMHNAKIKLEERNLYEFK